MVRLSTDFKVINDFQIVISEWVKETVEENWEEGLQGKAQVVAVAALGITGDLLLEVAGNTAIPLSQFVGLLTNTVEPIVALALVAFYTLGATIASFGNLHRNWHYGIACMKAEGANLPGSADEVKECAMDAIYSLERCIKTLLHPVASLATAPFKFGHQVYVLTMDTDRFCSVHGLALDRQRAH